MLCTHVHYYPVVCVCAVDVHGAKDTLGHWLQEEKDAILKWRDEHTGSDGNVTLCFV